MISKKKLTMTQRIARMINSLSSRLISLLLTAGLLSGCIKILDEKDIPGLKEPYLQRYSIAEPVEKVWQATLFEVGALNRSRDLVVNQRFHLISWADENVSDDCYKVRRTGITKIEATALTVIRIQATGSNGALVFVRKVCYPHDPRKDHGLSLGEFENEFVKRVRNRIGM